DLLDLPGANVADLPIILVVPSLSWDGVSYGLAQLMGTGRGQRVEYGEIACAARAIRIGHHGIENLPIDGIVIAAECLARACTSLVDCGPVWQVDKVKRVGRWLGERAIGNAIVQHLLNIAISY